MKPEPLNAFTVLRRDTMLEAIVEQLLNYADSSLTTMLTFPTKIIYTGYHTVLSEESSEQGNTCTQCTGVCSAIHSLLRGLTPLNIDCIDNFSLAEPIAKVEQRDREARAHV